MWRAALVLAGLIVARPAGAWCLLGCDEVTLGAEAQARAEAVLGVTLPPEATVLGLVEGGFQDRYLQARIEVRDRTLDATLAAFGLSRSGLGTLENAYFGPSTEPWFDPDQRPGLQVAQPVLGGFSSAIMGAAADTTGTWTLYLWAFQT